MFDTRRWARLIRAAVVVGLCAATHGVAASGAALNRVDYSGHKLVRVTVPDKATLAQLEAISPDIWNCHVRPGPIDARIPPQRMAALEASGLEFEIVIDDLGPATSQHFRTAGTGGPFDDYMPYDQILAFINNLVTTRPDICSLIDIGDTIEGRDIWVLRVRGTGGAPTRPAVFYHGLQHCREWITGPMVMYLADSLVSGYGSDACITELVDSVDFYLAPCVNPDGYIYTWDSERLWRKNRRDNGDGTEGVDLNRNWGFEWGGPGSSPDPGSTTYHGTGPFSEPETQALSNFILAQPEIVAYMDYHSYSQLILWPWGYQCAAPPAPDDVLYDAIGAGMQTLIQSVNGLQYVAGPICNTLYQVSGGSIDWAYGAAGALSFSIELRPLSSSPGFLLPPDQIRPTVEENLPAILHLSKWAAGYALDGSLVESAETLHAAGEPLAVEARLLPVTQTVATSTATLNYRFAPTAPWSTTPMQAGGGDSYTASVPGTNCRSRIEYFVTAEGSLGAPLTLPCAGAAVMIDVEQRDARFIDQFETDTGWIAENLGATSGDWQRGAPINDPNWDYDPSNDSDGSGQCWLTENLNNPAYNDPSNTDVDGGAVRLTSPVVDLTGDAVRVSYAYFLRLTSAGGEDQLLVEAAPDGGAEPWVTVSSHTADTSLTWAPVVLSGADLDAAGLTRTSAMRFRFTVNDDDPQTIVEAGIDDFRIMDIGCDPLLGDANGDGVLTEADYALLANCIGGANQPLPPTCTEAIEIFDADEDGDVDLADIAAIQRAVAP